MPPAGIRAGELERLDTCLPCCHGRERAATVLVRAREARGRHCWMEVAGAGSQSLVLNLNPRKRRRLTWERSCSMTAPGPESA
eukprot:635614-Rhodomonas_salina.1